MEWWIGTISFRIFETKHFAFHARKKCYAIATQIIQLTFIIQVFKQIFARCSMQFEIVSLRWLALHKIECIISTTLVFEIDFSSFNFKTEFSSCIIIIHEDNIEYTVSFLSASSVVACVALVAFILFFYTKYCEKSCQSLFELLSSYRRDAGGCWLWCDGDGGDSKQNLCVCVFFLLSSSLLKNKNVTGTINTNEKIRFTGKWLGCIYCSLVCYPINSPKKIPL